MNVFYAVTRNVSTPQADPEELSEEFDTVLAEGIKFRDIDFMLVI